MVSITYKFPFKKTIYSSQLLSPSLRSCLLKGLISSFALSVEGDLRSSFQLPL